MRLFTYISYQFSEETLKLITKDVRSRSVSVLDLACGKGGDLLKWKTAEIGKTDRYSLLF